MSSQSQFYGNKPPLIWVGVTGAADMSPVCPGFATGLDPVSQDVVEEIMMDTSI